MQQSYGKLIKLTRIEKNMNQEELCEGICTPSYLSRIENDRVVADEQIYKLLLTKLGLQYKTDTLYIQEIDAQIEQWYEKVLTSEQTLIDIEALRQKAGSANDETYLKFKLVYCRHLLNLSLLTEVEQQLRIIENTIPPNNKRLHFMYTNVLVIFHYYNKKFANALEIGEQALSLEPFEAFAKPIEIGKFYYNLAATCKKLYQYEKGIHYGNKALNIFREWYYMDLILQCHIILGVCYNNTKKLEQAFYSYEVARSIIHFLPEQKHSLINGIIDNNTAHCYENSNDLNQALHYYLKCYSHSENSDQVQNIINIIRCYYTLKDFEQARHWLEIANKIVTHPFHEKYMYPLQVFQVILHNTNIAMNDLKILEEETLRYFKAEQLSTFYIYYCKLFAELYKKRNQYKKAS